ncbi:MAG: hypothetical protein SFW66_09005 [Gammaproteobacteria bacterium]|nr:hypothetical protein [Gammaproteobacteria bacterium]
MTDRELNIAVAKLLAYDKNEHFLIGADGNSPGFIFNKTWYPFNPATSWGHAGPLLEMMPNTALIHATGTEPLVWECVTESDLKDGWIRQGLHETSPTRAICEAFLKWHDSDPEGFKKATGHSPRGVEGF